MLIDLLSSHKGEFKHYTELRAHVNNAKQVTILAGNMVTNTQSSNGGVSARVYKGGTFGFASGAEYSEEGIGKVLAAAADNADFMDLHVKKGQPPLPNLKSGSVGLRAAPGDMVPQSLLIDYAK